MSVLKSKAAGEAYLSKTKQVPQTLIQINTKKPALLAKLAAAKLPKQ